MLNRKDGEEERDGNDGVTHDSSNIQYCLHISKVICFYFFQMYPDVAGDVQSITGKSLHAGRRAIKHYKGPVVYVQFLTVIFDSLYLYLCV